MTQRRAPSQGQGARAERPVRGRQAVDNRFSTVDTTSTIQDALRAAGKPRKYRNVPQIADGYTFDSTKERDRYWELKQLERAGKIRSLEVHPRFPLVVHGIDCGVYEGDLGYVVVATGVPVLEDVKSPATRKLPTYRLKRKLVWALYGLEIREV